MSFLTYVFKVIKLLNLSRRLGRCVFFFNSFWFFLLLSQALQYGSEDNSTIIVVPFGAWGKHRTSDASFSFSRSFVSSGRWAQLPAGVSKSSSLDLTNVCNTIKKRCPYGNKERCWPITVISVENMRFIHVCGVRGCDFMMCTKLLNIYIYTLLGNKIPFITSQ